jgi:hypothetical protein
MNWVRASPLQLMRIRRLSAETTIVESSGDLVAWGWRSSVQPTLPGHGERRDLSAEALAKAEATHRAAHEEAGWPSSQ